MNRNAEGTGEMVLENEWKDLAPGKKDPPAYIVDQKRLESLKEMKCRVFGKMHSVE